MKSLAKFCLIVASIFVVLGIVGIVAGVSLGARPSQFMRMVHHRDSGWLWNHHWGLWNDWDWADDIEDLQDDLQDDLNDWTDDLKDETEDWQEDIADWKEDMDEWGNIPAIGEIEEASGENVDVQEGIFGGAHTENLKPTLPSSSRRPPENVPWKRSSWIWEQPSSMQKTFRQKRLSWTWGPERH